MDHSNKAQQRQPTDPAQDGPLNQAQLEESADGDKEFMQELLDIFVSDSNERLEALEIALCSGDNDAVNRVAHTLKGASATVGADDFQAVARNIEFCARDGEIDQARSSFDELKDEWDRIISYLEK